MVEFSHLQTFIHLVFNDLRFGTPPAFLMGVKEVTK